MAFDALLNDLCLIKQTKLLKVMTLMRHLVLEMSYSNSSNDLIKCVSLSNILV